MSGIDLCIKHLRKSSEAIYDAKHPEKLAAKIAMDSRVSSPGESHPEALAELYVSLSTHTAPIMEPRRTPICQ